MRNNALLSTFHDEPALLHTGMQTRFEAYLSQAQATLTRIETAPEAAVMQDDFWPAADSWLASWRPYIVKAGILLIPVKGVLLHNLSYAIGDYATGYVYITKALERGLADEDVKGIALVIDSGGGHVAGNFDLVDKIFEGRSVKPIRAYASEHAYSAAYSIASAADSVTVSRTGGVGSIGVVTVHLDMSKAMDQEGYKITFIHFGKHKVDGNPYEPLPPDVEKRIQARINELGEVFVSSVARNRSMDAQAVRDTEALTFTAKEATSNGLADSIGSLDDAIAVFAADMSNQEEDDMSTPQAVYNARSEGLASGTQAGKREGASAERNRISTILDSDEGKKRPVAARAAAFETDLSTEQVAVFLGKLPEEKPSASNGGLSRAQRALQLSGRSLSTANNDGQPSRAQQSRAHAALAAAGRLKVIE